MLPIKNRASENTGVQKSCFVVYLKKLPAKLDGASKSRGFRLDIIKHAESSSIRRNDSKSVPAGHN